MNLIVRVHRTAVHNMEKISDPYFDALSLYLIPDLSDLTLGYLGELPIGMITCHQTEQDKLVPDNPLLLSNDRQGNLYIWYVSEKIRKFDALGNLICSWSFKSQGDVLGMACLPNGGLCIINRYRSSKRLLFFDAEGKINRSMKK
jgi:hypothetical protein